MQSEKRYSAFPWRTALLMLSVAGAIVVSFLCWGADFDAWMRTAVEKCGDRRWLAASVLFLALASDIVLPVPSSLASTLCGILLGPWLGLPVSFLAMSASAFAGYEIGARFAGAARRAVGEDDWRWLSAMQAKGGRWLLVALRPVPVLSEASAMMAGVVREPRAAAYAKLALGNLAVSAVYVAAGAWFSAEEGSASAAFLVCMGLTLACMAASSGWRRRGAKKG